MKKKKKLKEGEQPKGNISKRMLEKGTDVCVLAGPRSWEIENWIIDVREASGQKVDWYFVGGRAFVMAMGDLDKVRKAIAETKGAFNERYRATQTDRDYKFDIQWG